MFELDHWERGGWTVLSVNGELDVATAPRLRQEAVKLVNGGTTQVAIDLSGCSFLDSTGLGVIIGILKRVKGHDGELVIVGAAAHVQKVFEITRVSDIVALHDSLDEVVGTVDDG